MGHDTDRPFLLHLFGAPEPTNGNERRVSTADAPDSSRASRIGVRRGNGRADRPRRRNDRSHAVSSAVPAMARHRFRSDRAPVERRVMVRPRPTHQYPLPARLLRRSRTTTGRRRRPDHRYRYSVRRPTLGDIHAAASGTRNPADRWYDPHRRQGPPDHDIRLVELEDFPNGLECAGSEPRVGSRSPLAGSRSPLAFIYVCENLPLWPTSTARAERQTRYRR